jgi:hypothetical protein
VPRVSGAMIVATRKLEASEKCLFSPRKLAMGFMPWCRFMDDVEFTTGDQESFQVSSIQRQSG